MSKIQSFTSAQRGSIAATATAGEIYLESDTNKLLLYLGKNTWRGIDPSGGSLPSSYLGGADDLHYPDGLFFNPSATNYISTSPFFHYDATYLGGSAFPFKSFSPTEDILTLGDRSGNGFNCSRVSSAQYAYLDRNVSSDLSGGSNTSLALKSNTAFELARPFPVKDVTMFFIQCSQASTNSSFTSPLSPHAEWGTFENNADGTTNFYYSTPDITTPRTWYSDGPTIRIGRSDSENGIFWAPSASSAPVGAFSDRKISVDNAKSLFTAVLREYAQYTWEIIFFNKALDIASINTVKNYLENKYNGFTNISPTPDLTES